MSEDTGAALARLRELARKWAHREHRLCADTDGHGVRDGHRGLFRVCLHVNCLLVRAEPPAEGWRPTEIDCPLCGTTVQQVASATLSLALWQHVNWACRCDRNGLTRIPLPPSPPEGSQP